MAADHAVAVVGTRKPTEPGRAIAGRIGGALAKAGAVVVSGLAVGIDGASHAAAMAEGAPTVAVLGSGHGRLYPRAHAKLAERIVADGGAVVSEFVPERPPSIYTFPRRNRLISGLADATVVVEAGSRSGALITAGLGARAGSRPVPGPGLDRRAAVGGLPRVAPSLFPARRESSRASPSSSRTSRCSASRSAAAGGRRSGRS
jgi:DNA processing protein